MKTAEEYLEEHTDQYAQFAYKNGNHGMSSTYSEAGIEVEHARKYAIMVAKEELEMLLSYLKEEGDTDKSILINIENRIHNLRIAM